MRHQPPSPLDFCTFDLSVNEQREEVLTQQLIAFNQFHAPLSEQNRDGQFTAAPLHLYFLNAEQQVIGGLIGRTHLLRAWFEVSLLWVDEKCRGRGIGRVLIERAEVEAIRRGCLYARLATSQYQAPGFYEKVGYVLYGKLENCPPGDTTFYYRKDLASPKENG